MVSCLEIEVVCIQVASGESDERRLGACYELDLQLLDDGMGDLILDCKNVFQHPVVTFGPQVVAVRNVD